MVPEDVGRKAAHMLLEEIHRGGVTDGSHQVTAHLIDHVWCTQTCGKDRSMSIMQERPDLNPTDYLLTYLCLHPGIQLTQPSELTSSLVAFYVPLLLLISEALCQWPECCV